MRTTIFTKTVACLLCFILTVPFLPALFSRAAKAQTVSPAFFTSFEKGDPMPAWTDVAETDKNGAILSSGITAAIGSGQSVKTMRTSVGGGPDNLYAAPKKGGWTGSHALTYSGKVVGGKGSFAYNKVYSLDIPVNASTQLSYFVAPVSPKNDPGSDVSSYISIDLAFSDGTYLHQISQAVDQDGIRMTPSAQGQSGTLITNQWNHKTADIGKAAQGKTITRLLVAYTAPKSGATFQGTIDDIQIGNAPKTVNASSPADEVNILRGTASSPDFSRGNTIPAVAVPNSFAFWSPAIDSSASDQPYPYSENNDPQNLPEIQSFSLSHSPNFQNGDRQSFQVMPSDFTGTPGASRLNRGLPFQRTNETAKPYYYGVTFLNGMKAEMAPASHSAILRFTFKGNTGNLIFDNLDSQGGLTLSPDQKSIEGYSDVKDSTTGNTDRFFFYASFDQPVTDFSRLFGQGRGRATAFYKFDTSKEKTVTMRIGYSLISTVQAKKNLGQEIGGNEPFSQVEQNAKTAWNSMLGKVSVQGAGSGQRTTLYSSLYRLFLYPNAGFENTGSNERPDYRYADLTARPAGKNTADKTGAPIKSGKVYVNSNFAYSAQTVWPAYALLEPGLTGQLISGFLQYEKNGGTISNPGSFADMAFSDAYVKGVPGVNQDLLYQTVLKDASASGGSGVQGRPQPNTAPFAGYTNSDQQQSINWTLSDSINDFALGSLASNLSRKQPGRSYQDDSAYYLSRAQNYLNIFNRTTELFSGKTADGHWQSGSGSWSGAQASPNIWNLAFDVPQDGQGLANLYGGRSGLSAQLDKFFSSVPSAASTAQFPMAREAAAGRLGLFTLDSPSSPSIPYMYTFVGAPWKTQETVRSIMNHFFSGGDIGQGYLGDDTGAMLSGFYFFGAAGFYPLQKGSPDYVLGAPYFSQMTIHLENGRDLVIKAPNVSNTNQYVQSVTFNGRSYSEISIPYDLLAGGGTLSFQMGSSPSNWGTSAGGLPNSLTPLSTNGSSIYPMPLSDLTDGWTVKKQADISASDKSSVDPMLDNQSDTAAVFLSSQPAIVTRFNAANLRVKMYTLTSSGDNQTTSDPKSWILFGSDDGKNWDWLDSRSNETFAWRSMTRSFSISNPKPYRFYKLQITQKSGSTPLAISEYQLLGYAGIDSSFSTMRQHLISEFDSMNLSEANTASLSYALNQAQTAYEQGKILTSVYYLQTYVQRLHAFVFKNTGQENAKSRLLADAQAVVNLLSD